MEKTLSGKRITLNVGGKLFETTTTSFFRFPNSFLATMFDSRNDQIVKPDSKGHYFIDRNGNVFEVILDLYRTGLINNYKNFSEEVIQAELDYFQIEDVIEEKEKTVDVGKDYEKKSKDSAREAIKEYKDLYNLLIQQTQKALRNASTKGLFGITIRLTSKGQTYFGDYYEIMNVGVSNIFATRANQILFVKDLEKLGIKCSPRGVYQGGEKLVWLLDILIWQDISWGEFELWKNH